MCPGALVNIRNIVIWVAAFTHNVKKYSIIVALGSFLQVSLIFWEHFKDFPLKPLLTQDHEYRVWRTNNVKTMSEVPQNLFEVR